MRAGRWWHCAQGPDRGCSGHLVSTAAPLSSCLWVQTGAVHNSGRCQCVRLSGQRYSALLCACAVVDFDQCFELQFYLETDSSKYNSCTLFSMETLHVLFDFGLTMHAFAVSHVLSTHSGLFDRVASSCTERVVHSECPGLPASTLPKGLRQSLNALSSGFLACRTVMATLSTKVSVMDLHMLWIKMHSTKNSNRHNAWSLLSITFGPK